MSKHKEMGARLRIIRRSRGISTYKLAAIMHCRPSVIQRVERGERRLLFEEAVELCTILSISLDQLAGLEPL